MKETSRKQRTVSTARQRHADPIGQRVHDPKADIVATTLILRTGIAQAHHDPQYRTSSGDRTSCLLAFFDLFRLLLADHLRLSRFLLLYSRSPFRRYPLNQYRHHGPRRIVKYLDVARHGQLADMNGVAQIKLADIYLDMTGNRSRQALDGDLAQMRLQQASLDLHPDRLPHQPERNLDLDLALHGDLEEIGVQWPASYGIPLHIFHNDRPRLLAIPIQGEGDQDILASPAPQQLHHLEGINGDRRGPGLASIHDSRNQPLSPKTFRSPLTGLHPNQRFQHCLIHRTLLPARRRRACLPSPRP